ncbi:MAG: ABC transporter ATP-binding protein [Ferruginibacter sp.]
MNPYNTTRMNEVKNYFDNGDIHLGYRRLLDAAIETQNSTVYEATLEFCYWYDTVTDHSAGVDLSAHVNALLEKIAQAPVPENTNTAPVLTAVDISKKYSSGSFSLSKLDISLQRSQIIGLVGENGNGKTTLLRLLFGELQPDTGSIQYNLQHVPERASFYDIKTRLAFIPQRPNAWYGSLMDNLQFTSAHYGMKGKENFLWTEMIAARMGLRPFRTYTWSKISSGYKMRFELAKTLLRRPEILLLDEPLANLDVLAQQIILEDLKYMAQSVSMPLSIILSSQQLYEVEKVSEQVIFLQKGVARFQHTKTETNDTTESVPLVIELETTASRDALQQLFGKDNLQKLSFNGGVYILYFEGSITAAEVTRKLGEAGLSVKYFRDISSSSRRFFDA